MAYDKLGGTMEVKIKLKVKDVEIELTMEEAKDLRDVLSDLAGAKEVVKYVDRYPWYQWPTYPASHDATPWVKWSNGSMTTESAISDNVMLYASVS